MYNLIQTNKKPESMEELLLQHKVLEIISNRGSTKRLGAECHQDLSQVEILLGQGKDKAILKIL